MSAKHHQRTRAEILGKRQAPISTWKGFAKFGVPAVITIGRNADVRKASRSKYTPHTGAKEQARAKRCRMDFLHGAHSAFSDNERSAPTLSQMSKSAHAEQEQFWQQEYDSVF